MLRALAVAVVVAVAVEIYKLSPLIHEKQGSGLHS
jgi:hypothetical protein